MTFFVLFWGHIFDQILHKNVDFEGVLKKNKNKKDILGFLGGMIFFVAGSPCIFTEIDANAY